MRVKDTGPAERVGRVGLNEAGGARLSREAGVGQADRVTIDESLDQESIAAAVRREVGAVRQERLAEIEAAIKNGTYRPNARAISERIIAAAALDAQLAMVMRVGR